MLVDIDFQCVIIRIACSFMFTHWKATNVRHVLTTPNTHSYIFYHYCVNIEFLFYSANVIRTTYNTHTHILSHILLYTRIRQSNLVDTYRIAFIYKLHVQPHMIWAHLSYAHAHTPWLAIHKFYTYCYVCGIINYTCWQYIFKYFMYTRNLYLARHTSIFNNNQDLDEYFDLFLSEI